MTPASQPTFTDRSFRFLTDLAANNDTLTERLSQREQPLAGSEKTMYRMSRDVRFSADKRPYTTAVSGPLTPRAPRPKTRDWSTSTWTLRVDSSLVVCTNLLPGSWLQPLPKVAWTTGDVVDRVARQRGSLVDVPDDEERGAEDGDHVGHQRAGQQLGQHLHVVEGG